MTATPLPEALSPCHNVRRSCARTMEDPLCPALTTTTTTTTNDGVHTGRRTVDLRGDALADMAAGIARAIREEGDRAFVQWDEHGWHYTGNSYVRSDRDRGREERVALYVLALDAMNFCFWPAHQEEREAAQLEYEHLATALKRMAESDDVVGSTYLLSPTSLAAMTPARLHTLLAPSLPCPLPATEERCRLLNELGHGLLRCYHGSALSLVRAAQGSADRLVHLLLQTFPGFRDACVDAGGRPVCFYKRAQIAVGDLRAALGKEYVDDDGIGALTTFADYRIPQLLRHAGVLRYAPELAERIDRRQELRAGEAGEIYIRAATVVAVERLVEEVNKRLVGDGDDAQVNAVTLDWYLWQSGERLEQEGRMAPHHRVRTIYY